MYHHPGFSITYHMASGKLRHHYIPACSMLTGSERRERDTAEVHKARVKLAWGRMFDSLKRAAWRSPDGAEFDDTKAMDMLKTIVSALKDEQMEEATFAGGFNSWSVTQGE